MEQGSEFHGRATLFGIISLFIYFFIIFILGFATSIYITILNNNLGFTPLKFLYDKGLADGNILNQFNLALIGALGTSSLGNSIYYIRKLYKLALGKKFLISIESKQDKLENIGTIFYFILRPFFAMSFGLLLLLGVKGGMFTISGNSLNPSSYFCDIIMFISFFIGFSTGKFLSSLEKKSEKIIDSLMKSKETSSNIKS